MAAASEFTTIASQTGVVSKDALWPALPVPSHIMLGARLEVKTAKGPGFGVVRWIGIFRGKGRVGLEMEQDDAAFNDGVLLQNRMFVCPARRGFFVSWNLCQRANAASTAGAQANAKNSNAWICPRCTLVNRSHQAVCGGCHAKRPLKGHGFPLLSNNTYHQRKLPDSWVCPKCTLVNKLMRPGCEACGASRPISVEVIGDPSTDRVNLSDAQSQADPATEWVCENCSLINSQQYPKCELCRVPRVDGDKQRNVVLQEQVEFFVADSRLVQITPEKEQETGGWACVQCTLVNPAENEVCCACDAAQPDGVPTAMAAAALSPDVTLQRMRDELQTILALQKAKPPEDPILSSLPKEWVPMSKSQGYKLVQLDSTTQEYQELLQDFNNSMNGRNVTAVYRIQNPVLWQFYKTKKVQMKNENGGVDVEERRLYHGTNIQHFDAICRDNFDWRLSGSSTGTSCGQGTYFGPSAQISDAYIRASGSVRSVCPAHVFDTNADGMIGQPGIPLTQNIYGQGQTRALFFAKVLVGKYTQGNSSMRKPPEGYDSCVDNPGGPSMFIIFEKTQIYPEYIIEYM